MDLFPIVGEVIECGKRNGDILSINVIIILKIKQRLYEVGLLDPQFSARMNSEPVELEELRMWFPPDW